MAKKVVRKKAAPKKTNGKNGAVRKEIIAIITVAIGIFVIVSLWAGSGGKIGELLSLFLKGMFGDVAYILPVTFIAAAVIAITGAVATKTTVTLCLPVVLSMLWHLIYRISNPAAEDGIKDLFSLQTLYNSGKSLASS